MFFERPAAGSRVLLVHVDDPTSTLSSSEELGELATSAGLDPVGIVSSSRRFPHPATFVGQGKLIEIRDAMVATDAEVVVFDEDLTPTHERNIEKFLSKRVLGRTGLILAIFADRARTHEGKLQVELAQLHHASSRLVRGWTHLDRQRGGSGRGAGSAAGLGGAGETQLEADQRLLGDRIKQVRGRLDRVRRQRQQNRRSRTRSEVRTVALAGYTNAGKSTLFNRISDAGVHAADQLFATLDPTLRRLELPVAGTVVLSDTVGFIRKLPHTLVDAFRATLEEVTEADLILHVIDAAAEEKSERIDEVNRVLEEIGAGEVPQLIVMNKSDLAGGVRPVERDASGMPTRVWLSAVTGEGVADLIAAVGERLAEGVVEVDLTIRPEEGRLRARCFSLGEVINETTLEDGSIRLCLRIEEKNLKRLGSEASRHNLRTSVGI